MERRVILAAMERKRGNVRDAAAALGIDRSTLYDKLKRYEIAYKIEKSRLQEDRREHRVPVCRGHGIHEFRHEGAAKRQAVRRVGRGELLSQSVDFSGQPSGYLCTV